MIKESEIIYREEQKFSLWIRWLVAASTVLVIPISIFSLTISSEQVPLNSSLILVLMFAGILVPITVALLFGMLKLQTEVRPDGLYVRFFPFHIKFKRFTAEDLSEFYVRQYKPVAEYGGWGIRYTLKKGRAYNASGDKGVQLVFKNGKRLLIGSQSPEELEEAIRSIMD